MDELNPYETLRVLVADDSDYMRLLLRTMLRGLGIDAVDFVESAEQAVRYLRRAMPDLLITDLKMPGMSGLDLARHVRRSEGSLNPFLSVLMLTGHAGAAEIEALQQRLEVLREEKHSATAMLSTLQGQLANCERDLREAEKKMEGFEWERGTMEAIMATPVTAAELLAGKVIPYFILALMSTTLCVVIAVFVFGVPFRGSIGALYALSAAFLVPSLGQGMLISAATKNQFLAAQIALISAFMPAFLLSGFLFEIGSMPRIIQWITVIVPARYLIPGLQTVFLAGDIWPLFLRDIAVMLLEGGILFALAIRNTKKRLA